MPFSGAWGGRDCMGYSIVRVIPCQEGLALTWEYGFRCPSEAVKNPLVCSRDGPSRLVFDPVNRSVDRFPLRHDMLDTYLQSGMAGKLPRSSVKRIGLRPSVFTPRVQAASQWENE
jgi:hypothetical protein